MTQLFCGGGSNVYKWTYISNVIIFFGWNRMLLYYSCSM